ncbi:SDR family NAD(P)-dependent oxidoreductase [Georgenia sp. TF02-10]|uniref:SDR family NAD(P)-dependent oxidoreductase n=1 Tax=Georgenia sp. TF02-10 TaxID=2917725 RepID=UPI001FA73B2F|nr:SDR family NAD(P)-dependent oxidoreductase [Georgenia sp. TF02-10]UNX54898.1 SDR family NAD(P)-dependent oxidoreductase [Georgenia sp. TF02-10]
MSTTGTSRPFAVVTGASSGIGRELANVLAENGYDLLLCAEDAGVADAAVALTAAGTPAEPVQVDLATYDGVEDLVAAIDNRQVDVVALNAGIGVGGPFLETDLDADLELIQLNVASVVHLTKRVLPGMVSAGRGRLLYTASLASVIPGPYYATYSASRAFVLNFAQAVRHELADTGVTVTALLPGPTDTEFFDRAGMTDTRVGHMSKDDPAEVARDGFEALMAGKDHVVAGSARNRVMFSSKGLPEPAKAAVHARLTEPEEQE